MTTSKSVKYVLRATGLELPVSVDAARDTPVRDVFLEAIGRHGIDESAAHSFWRVGDWIPRGHDPHVAPERYPGEELILAARELPEISKETWLYMSCQFSPRVGIYCDPAREQLADWVQPMVDELVELGLVAQGENKFGKGYFLTEDGLSYPQLSVSFSTQTKFLGRRPVVPREPETSSQPEM